MTKVVAELDEEGKYVIVRFPYEPRLVERIRRVPSRKFVDDDGSPYNRLNLDLAIMRRLREEFGDRLKLGPRLRAWGHVAVEEERVIRELASADDADLERVPNNLRWGDDKELRPYQRADIRLMAGRSIINANQPGAGKTAETFLALYEAGLERGRHLIVAPVTSLRLVWKTELEELASALDIDPPAVLTGDTPDTRREAITAAKALSDGDRPFWLVINPAMIRMVTVHTLEGEEVNYKELSGWDQMHAKTEQRLAYPELAEIDWTSFTIDEFHLMGLSNPNTQGAKGSVAIRKATSPARSYTLSGTPIRGKPIKLWGALNFLYPERFTSKWRWAETWLVVESQEHRGRSHSVIEGIMPGREDEFYDEHKPFLIRRTKMEALPGLPPKVHINVWCDMTRRQEKQYRTFAAEAEWKFEEQEQAGRLTATSILAEFTRLKQFADAYCKADELPNGDLSIRQTPDSGKLEQLWARLGEEAITDLEERRPALIFSQFNAMVEVIASELAARDLRVGVIHGGVKERDRKKMVDDFAVGTIDVLCLNTLAGTALNLSRADSVHILDETWVPDETEQAEDRAHRGDPTTMAKDEVRVYMYRTRGTIEEMIMSLVKGKKLNNRAVLDLRRKSAMT